MFVNEYDLPELKLADSTKVLYDATEEARILKAPKSSSGEYDFQQQMEDGKGEFFFLFKENVDRAQKVFQDIAGDKPTISIFRIGAVLSEFGLRITNADIDDIIQQLEMKDAMDVSFSEAVDIANYLAGDM